LKYRPPPIGVSGAIITHRTMHTRSPSYSPSKRNIPTGSARFPPLYLLLSHLSSFISLLHLNYPRPDPLVSLSPLFLSSHRPPPTHPPSLPLRHLVPTVGWRASRRRLQSRQSWSSRPSPLLAVRWPPTGWIQGIRADPYEVRVVLTPKFGKESDLWVRLDEGSVWWKKGFFQMYSAK
jgi:hypothetical protein